MPPDDKGGERFRSLPDSLNYSLKFLNYSLKMEGKKLFKKEINPYTVADKVTFRNVDRTLTLYVRGDAVSFVSGLRKAQEKLKEINNESDECEQVNCARFFASTLFGEDQSDKLMDFYNDPLAVITVCGMYFQKRLAKKITKAQKK